MTTRWKMTSSLENANAPKDNFAKLEWMPEAKHHARLHQQLSQMKHEMHTQFEWALR